MSALEEQTMELEALESIYTEEFRRTDVNGLLGFKLLNFRPCS
jgi:hypothetical protein